MTRRLTLALLALLLHIGLAPGIVLAAEPFTIVLLPDTQYYVDMAGKHYQAAKAAGEDWSRYLAKQVEWTIASKPKLNTVFAVQLGDITENNTEREWKKAADLFAPMQGRVPLIFAVGNHDLKPDRFSYFDKYFPRAVVEKEPWFGGSIDGTLTNAWYRFEAGGMKFVVISLEFMPRDEVLDWANKVVAEHPDERVIVVTHSYLSAPRKKGPQPRDFRVFINSDKRIAGNQGLEMWDKFVSRHANIFLVLCGHVPGENHQTSIGVHGNPVHELLADYQMWDKGGESWLQYLTFVPDRQVIEVYTYNPTLDQQRDTPLSRFTLPYAMN
jgi:hypothetical protein